MAKRKLELDDLDDTEPVPHASLHGVIKSLSPMRKGRKSDFFEGKFYFNNKSSPSRFVGFARRHHDTLKKMKEEKQPVHFDDIEIMKARRGDKMEFLVKSSTNISKSPKKFDPESFLNESDTCNINQLDKRQPYEKISLQVKAVKILRNCTGKNIQKVLIADSTGLCKCTLWEQFMGKLEPGKSYRLTEFYIREFQNKKSISNSMQGSKKYQNLTLLETRTSTKMKEKFPKRSVIAAILNFERYQACMRCKSRVEPIASNQGSEDCRTLQRINLCTHHISAKLLMKPLPPSNKMSSPTR